MKDKILDILKTELKLHPLRVMNIYLYGSQCYGTATDKSDYDFIVVAKASVENVEYSFDDFNFHVQTPDYFQERLDWNDPKVFECLLWSKKQPILNLLDFNIKIEKPKYRHAVSHISSNSWVKAKKKIEQGDIHIGQKSLYHSLRIPMFATQIMEHNDIIDWECANEYWRDIKQMSDWEELKQKYQPIRNGIMTMFRNICQKQ